MKSTALRFGKQQQLSEADVTAQVKDFLTHKGWRAFRQSRGKFRNPQGNMFTIGEAGLPDWLYVFYVQNAGLPGAAIVLWVEKKGTGKHAKCICATKTAHQACTACDQKAWREYERKRGAQVWIVDDLDGFMRAYKATFSYLHTGDLASGQLELIP